MLRSLIACSLAAAALGSIGAFPAAADSVHRSQLDDGRPIVPGWNTTERFDAVTLAGPDELRVVEGNEWRIRASGDPQVLAELRYLVEDGSIVVGRRWRERPVEGRAVIEIVAPAIEGMTLAGPGTMRAARLDGETVSATVAGSGDIDIDALAARRFDGTVAGSGRLLIAGTSADSSFTVAGSGTVDARRLSVETADVSVAGSGDVALHADRSVSASIVGSGDVTVTGAAQCSESRMGSGRLRCQG